MTSASAERGREVRQRLLAAAAQLIGERGWTAVSTRILAQRAGVTPSVVHYHFPSLQALLREAVVGAMGQVVVETTAMLDGAEDATDVVAELFTSVDSYTGDDLTSLLFIEAFLAATRDPVLREQIAGVLAGLRADLGGRLAARGVADPDDTAAVLLAALDGILLHRGLAAGSSAAAAGGVLARLVIRHDDDD